MQRPIDRTPRRLAIRAERRRERRRLAALVMRMRA